MKLRVVLLSLSAFVFLLSGSQIIYGCTCEFPSSKKSVRKQVIDAKRSSQAVFSGRVLAVEEASNKNFLRVKVRVESSWKGVEGDEIVLVTGRGGGDCGYPFEVGELYLIYAYRTTQNLLSTNICQRTALLEDAKVDALVLGKQKIRDTSRF